MKNLIPLFLLLLTILGCSSVKKTQEALNYGNYDEAINIALKNLRSNKLKKSNQPYVFMLEEAFIKVVERDLERIIFLKKEGNASNLEQIHNSYLQLNNRQENIKPLLPLPILQKGKNARFNITDYTNDIINSKNKLSNYLYVNAKNTLKNSINKFDFRNAYDDLHYLNKLSPNYKDINNLLEESHFKGTDFVLVSMLNRTNKIIPLRLQKDLLNFDTYKLNDFWTVYHNNKQSKINYDYQLEIFLKEINISPEHIKEKEYIREKDIKNGWKYLKDNNGEIVKDSTGKQIKVDTYKKVRCKLNEIAQSKSTQVVGQLKYYNLTSNQLLKSFPLASEFIFENKFATYKGDKKALNKKDLRLINNKFIRFPSSEQMVYDSGENLKEKIKRIITSHKFR